MPVFRSVAVLSVTQIVAWGVMFMAVSVTAADMARDLALDPSTVYLGPTVMLVAMALVSPLLAPLYERYGARLILAAGSTLAAPGLWLLSISMEAVTHFCAWAILGVAGSATLTTSAHIFLSDIAGAGARRAIGAQMLAMALAPSISWPTTVLLQSLLGWRLTLFAYGCAMLFVCAPLHLLALPRASQGKTVTRGVRRDQIGAIARATPPGRVAVLITVAVALNGFVTWGFQLVAIDLFRSFSVPEHLAVGFGSAIGVVQLSARLFDFLGGNRWDGLSTGLVAAIIMPLALIALIAGNGSDGSIVLFLLLYGLSSGAMSVSRATMPLVFFSAGDYASVMARLALPLNLAFAVAAPFFSYVLGAAGNRWALSIAILSSLGTLASMVALTRLRPPSETPS